ncbi:MAG: helix-turn-helix domain-containing GNAT family N-acetyltransferase [Mesorhizobium sp.]|nr:helix-turn-helix domain-containing GNAT family N-acetyltransferase [Mesorhizobium sp.]
MGDVQLDLIAAVRRFNRFYTRQIGLLEETLTRSEYTLAEARVLFELGHRTSPAPPDPGGERGFFTRTFHAYVGPAASEIADELSLDPAYLTRILRKFAACGLIEVRVDAADRRRRILSLTESGKAALERLQSAADEQTAALVGDLDAAAAETLAASLAQVSRLLGESPAAGRIVVLRPHRIGDVGWVIQRQAVIYARDYGWNGEFEALLAEIGARFIRDFRPGRDFCWIAEIDGAPAGTVFLVHDPDDADVARLRMLHVERGARGLGVGRKLVDTCIDQARASGYRRLVLWTNDILHEARHIYERAGFGLTAEERHHSFGKDLVGQTWELGL